MGWFDGDEHPDLALGYRGDPGAGWIEILTGNGTGFETVEGAFESALPWHPAHAADVDGDGRQELLRNAELFFFGPEGALSQADVFEVGTSRVADVDSDGDVDLITGAGERLLVRYGEGNGTFVEEAESFADIGSMQLHIADFDGDGLHDVLFVDTPGDPGFPGDSAFQLLRGVGDGFFEADPVVELPPVGVESAAGDFDCDGKHELVLTSQADDTVEMWTLDAGGQTWSLVTTLEVVDPSLPVAAELNGDGAYDLVVGAADYIPRRILVYPGDGQGGFADPIELWAADDDLSYVANLSAADVFGQGVQSLIVTIFDDQLAVFHPPL